MRLYHQLTEEEQHQAMHFCVDQVLGDLIDGNIELDLSEENATLNEKLQAALEHIKTLTLPEEKGDYLMNEPMISELVFDIVDDMTRQAYYHEPGEMVIYTSDLTDGEEEEAEEDDMDFGGSKKSPHSLN
jgi:hypothetical protein